MAARIEAQMGSLAKLAPRSKWKHVLHGLKRDKFLYLLIAPGLLFFLLFKYVPMWGIVIAFQDYSPYMGVAGSSWVGFDHFIRFFSNEDFYLLFRNTMAISLLKLLFFFPLPILLSLLLNELRSEAYKKWIQTIVYMPHFLSWVIIAGITFLLLSQSSGIVNKLLASLGYAKYDFLTNENNFWIMLVIQNIWKETVGGRSFSLPLSPALIRSSTKRRRWTGRAGFVRLGMLRCPRSEASLSFCSSFGSAILWTSDSSRCFS